MFDERLKKMVEDIKDGGGSDCGCGLRAIKGRYNDFAFSLRRHKMNKGHSCGGCVMGQGALEDGLHVLGRSAQTTGRDFVLREYSALAGLCATFCQHGINKVLKERTAMFKMGGEYIHPQWRLGCYWEQLYGFHPYVGVSNMEWEADWLMLQYLKLKSVQLFYLQGIQLLKCYFNMNIYDYFTSVLKDS